MLHTRRISRKPHQPAQIVLPALAIGASTTGETRLNSHAITDFDGFDFFADRGNDARRFVAEDYGRGVRNKSLNTAVVPEVDLCIRFSIKVL
jgi:hypothetical protein